MAVYPEGQGWLWPSGLNPEVAHQAPHHYRSVGYGTPRPMDRRERITRFITPQQKGVEIGPYVRPLAPKRLGYNCPVLDVLDAATLRQLAIQDPNIPEDWATNIEEVDLRGSCHAIDEIVAAQVFDEQASRSHYRDGERKAFGFSLDRDPANVVPEEALGPAFQAWRDLLEHPDDAYRDAHCWTFTPASLELIIRDLRFLKLRSWEILEISETVEDEFFVLSEKPQGDFGNRNIRSRFLSEET